MDINIIIDLISNKKILELRNILINLNPVSISEILSELDPKEGLLIYRLLSKDLAVDVFSYLEAEDQENIIRASTDVELQTLIDDLYFDDIVDLVEEMPAALVKRIIANSTKENRKLINQFLKFPEDSAGSLMTIEYVSLRPQMLVKEAIDHIRKVGKDKETIYTCYLTDNSKTLIGTLSLKSLILSDENLELKDIATTEDLVFVNAYDDQEIIADKFKKYDLIAVPVTDKEHRLIGIITIDDIVDVIDEENTEDIHKMAAISPMEEKYMDISIWGMAQKRIPWLAILMISASLTSMVISTYSSALEKMVVLSSFIPLLTGTSGNAGAQTSTLVIRSLSLGEIKKRDALTILFKEFRIGIYVGAVLAIINFFRLYYLEIALIGDPNKLKISLLVSAAMMFTIIMSKATAGLLPLGVKAIKLDPALVANPLITTIIDVLSLIVYFNLIKMFFNI